MSEHRTILCGKGRLGFLIASALDAKNVAYGFARIDAERGLIQHDHAITGTIDTIILCFVPRHEEGKSGWSGSLNGLLKQVQRKELAIGRVLFISSTSVYESIAHGFVDAHTPVTGASVRSQGLLEAESVIPQLASNTAIFRLTGLVGSGYLKYDPLAFSHDKPRQAIDTRAVAQEVEKWFSPASSGHQIEVLTDGSIYWQGRKLDAVKDANEIEELGKSYRLLRPSIVC